MVTKKSWEEFRGTGLLLIANQILQIFGWSIIIECNIETGDIVDAYPARVKYRGFSEEQASAAYIKISEYMTDNHQELEKEAKQ